MYKYSSTRFKKRSEDEVKKSENESKIGDCSLVKILLVV